MTTPADAAREWFIAMYGGHPSEHPVDDLAALIEAREREAFAEGFAQAIEQAGDIHPNIRVTCDHEEANGSPGCACMGTVIHYRDEIRKLRVRPEPQP